MTGDYDDGLVNRFGEYIPPDKRTCPHFKYADGHCAGPDCEWYYGRCPRHSAGYDKATCTLDALKDKS